MRIAHLPSAYFPDSLGGTEVYVQTLCDELERLGHSTAVVWHSGTRQDLPYNATVLGEVPPQRRSEVYTRHTGIAPPGFGQFLRDWRPDVVHFHAFTAGSGVDHVECCGNELIPYVVTYHAPSMSCLRGQLLRWGTDVCDGRLDARRCAACGLEYGWPKVLARLASLSPLPHRWIPDSPLVLRTSLPSVLAEAAAMWKRFFMGAEKVIACAEFCRDVLLANGVPPEHILLERQALAGLERLRTLRLPLRLRRERPLRIGCFGRIATEKAPEMLLALVNRLRANGVAAEGTWLGPIDSGDEAWASAMFSAGSPNTRYGGIKRGNELAEWIRGCDLIVIPSRTMETGPLTLLEAWDQGTPVIGGNRGGIREFMIANSLQECLFEIDDTASMVAAVRRLLTWKGPQPVVRIPGMRSLAERMVAVYHAACTGAGNEQANCEVNLQIPLPLGEAR